MTYFLSWPYIPSLVSSGAQKKGPLRVTLRCKALAGRKRADAQRAGATRHYALSSPQPKAPRDSSVPSGGSVLKMEYHRQGARQTLRPGRAKAHSAPLRALPPRLPGDGDATQRRRALASRRPPHAGHAPSLAPARANEPVTQASGSRRSSIGTLSHPRPCARSTSPEGRANTRYLPSTSSQPVLRGGTSISPRARGGGPGEILSQPGGYGGFVGGDEARFPGLSSR